MPDQEIDDETPATVATVEAPLAEKPVRRPRRPKAERAATAVDEAPAEDAAPEAPAEVHAEVPENNDGNGSEAPPIEASAADEIAESTESTAQKLEQPPVNLSSETLDIRMLKEMKLPDIARLAKDHGVENASGMRKQDLIFAILQAQTERSGLIFSEGVLECLP